MPPRPVPDTRLEDAHGGRVAGVDEVGRGPLAGPVLAAAVILPRPLPPGLRDRLRDSKALGAGQRERALLALRESGASAAIGAASVAEITARNILAASLLAMSRAVRRLGVPPDLVLVDGDRPPALPVPVRCVVGGDAACLSIAAASIVAKVARDGLMARLDRRWPGYGWAGNAGYGTARHRAAMAELGVTPHHRPTFAPVRALLAGGIRARNFPRLGC